MEGMASCLYICDPFTQSRTLVKSIDLKETTVQELKGIVWKLTNIPINQQELMYFGKCLDDDLLTLDLVGIQDQVTIYILKKFSVLRPKDNASGIVLLDEVKSFLTRGRKSAYRVLIHKLVKDEEVIEKLISESDDPVTTVILRDSSLLLSFIGTASPEKIVSDYPTLAFALLKISRLVDSLPKLIQSSNSENENVDEEEWYGNQFNGTQSGISEVYRDITPSTSSMGSSRSQISASDLANALSFASMSQTDSPMLSSQQPSPEQLSEAQSQMRAMGIVDDALSWRALVVSGGNVQAAINLIFEGMI